jgi:4'-phosphopantetheinyl transferase
VWSVALDAQPASVGAVLSEDELLRAARFKVEDGRRNFVAARGALRILLGRYLNEDPTALRFTATTNGKPGVVHPSMLQFNVSHSGTAGLIAIAGTDVGVDIEKIAPRQDLEALAKRVFTTSEREAIAGDQSAFYRHWVAKEAFVKATGRGIASVRSFEVLLDAPGGARLVHVGGDVEEAARWTLTEIEAPRGYAAALVARGQATVVGPNRFEP